MQVAACAFAPTAVGAAGTSDQAVIVNGGSTNTIGYTIAVRPDGTGSLTMQHGTAKSLHLSGEMVKKFFTDLAAAQHSTAATTGCIKSASFGSSTHVTWHGWTSGDLECPPGDAAGAALVNDVKAIREAAGIGSAPLRTGPQIESPAPP